MKILLIGGSGAVGRAAAAALSPRHDVITAGRTSGDFQCDVYDDDSVQSLLQQVGNIDALISAFGEVHFGPLPQTTRADFMLGLERKLMAQVNLVTRGLEFMNDGGSFTVTSGVTNRDPIRDGTCAAMANGALDGFVVGAAVDMPRGIRINAVSPEVLESCREAYDGYFPGHRHVSDEEVGLAYCRAVEGCRSGEVIIVE